MLLHLKFLCLCFPTYPNYVENKYWSTFIKVNVIQKICKKCAIIYNQRSSSHGIFYSLQPFSRLETRKRLCCLQPSPQKTSCGVFRRMQNCTPALIFLLIREYSLVNVEPRSLVVSESSCTEGCWKWEPLCLHANKGREKVSKWNWIDQVRAGKLWDLWDLEGMYFLMRYKMKQKPD